MHSSWEGAGRTSSYAKQLCVNQPSPWLVQRAALVPLVGALDQTQDHPELHVDLAGLMTTRAKRTRRNPAPDQSLNPFSAGLSAHPMPGDSSRQVGEEFTR